MLSITHIFGFLLLLAFVSAENSSKACSLELEKIIASPLDQNGLNFDDRFLKWADEIRAAGPILFTPNNATVYWTLEQKYNIQIISSDGFSNGWFYSINPPSIIYYNTRPMSANVNSALINYPGFSYRQDTGVYHLTFTVYNTDGRFLMVTFLINRD